jgi:protein-S-isoprenylcysteine O-methyltransferase Ste14
MLVVGLIAWAWSAFLVLTRVPRGELITTGPYRLVRHPLYTAVALLVLPSIGFLLNSWLGAAIGVVMYLASRRYAPDEERELAGRFGRMWDAYLESVAVPWL